LKRVSTPINAVPIGFFWGDALKAVTSFYGVLEWFIPLVEWVSPLQYFSPQKVEPEENEGRDCFAQLAKDTPSLAVTQKGFRGFGRPFSPNAISVSDEAIRQFR
jgi:hypothetical protein